MARECQRSVAIMLPVSHYRACSSGSSLPARSSATSSSQPPMCWPSMKICGTVLRPLARRIEFVSLSGAMRSVDLAERHALGGQQTDRAGTVRTPGLRVDFDLRHRVLLGRTDSGLRRHGARAKGGREREEKGREREREERGKEREERRREKRGEEKKGERRRERERKGGEEEEREEGKEKGGRGREGKEEKGEDEEGVRRRGKGE